MRSLIFMNTFVTSFCHPFPYVRYSGTAKVKHADSGRVYLRLAQKFVFSAGGSKTQWLKTSFVPSGDFRKIILGKVQKSNYSVISPYRKWKPEFALCLVAVVI